mgnify:CR=1 FL=1
MKTTIETQVIEGSGNVFIDLGFSPAEAHNLTVRSEMMLALRRYIRKERLTQAQAAEVLEVSQPRVSDLMRGKIGRFSLDSLVTLLGQAGLEVTLKVRPRRAA